MIFPVVLLPLREGKGRLTSDYSSSETKIFEIISFQKGLKILVHTCAKGPTQELYSITRCCGECDFRCLIEFDCLPGKKNCHRRTVRVVVK